MEFPCEYVIEPLGSISHGVRVGILRDKQGNKKFLKVILWIAEACQLKLGHIKY